MSQQLRAGIIGGGFMARVHSRAIRDSGHLISGIASSSFDSAVRAGAQLGISRVFETWQALVESPDIDVVHICTPNEFHAEMVIAAANAGKQIVCEKPISVSFEEAQQIRSAVEASGSGFAVPFAYRFYPAVREMRDRIQSGEAGPIHLIHGAYLQDWLALEGSNNWRVDSVAGGLSRAFADIGTHWCDLMEFVSGDRIVALMANTSKAYQSRSGRLVQNEDAATIIFETESGATGSLTVSQVSHGRKNQLKIELDGALASYTFNQERPDALFVGGQSSNQVVVSGHETLTSQDAKRLAVVPSGHPQGYQDAFNALVADAYAGFQGKSVFGVPGLTDGVRASALVDAVLESAATKQWVKVESVHRNLVASRLAS
ncbi:MAG: Gfo/Idh/MocA family protein [Micrococcales bacterium]